MTTHATTTLEDKPVLIVDKEGILGSLILNVLVQRHATVYVSKIEPSPRSTQCIYIPFRRKIPVIPDTVFSHLFVIYQGEHELLEALPSFIKKAKENGAKLVFLTTIFQLENKDLQKYLDRHKDLSVLIVGDMFGEKSFHESAVKLLLDEAKTTGTMTLLGSGLDVLYPVATGDVIDGIIALAMGGSLPGQYALFSKHPPTALSFVRLLQKTYPLLKIDFRKGKSGVPKPLLNEDTVYVFGNTYPLEARLRKLDLSHTPLASKQHVKRKKRLRSRQLSTPRRQWLLLFSLLFFLLSLPFLLSVGLSAASGALLLSAQHSLEKGNIAQAEKSSKVASSLFSVANVTTTTMKEAAGVIGLDDELVGFQTTIQTGGIIAEAFYEGSSSLLLVQEVMLGKSDVPEEDFRTGLNRGREALRLVQRLIAEGHLPKRYREEMEKWQPTIAMVSNTMDAYPMLLGFEKTQKYLVLFQNNYELRSTGGFIGSYGLLSVEQGRVLDFTIHDVYDADGKLQEKVVPPFALARHMGASNWFLRDSNYYLDFPQSAGAAANFLKLETGEVVDGVIAIDVYFLASLLEATGPLPIPDYNETLTQENFFLVTQTHAEKDFFPGSTQKKDFLRAVRTSFEDKLSSKNVTSYANLLSVLTKAVTQKHVLFAFADERVQKLFTVNNMSGAMWDSRVEKKTQVNDYLSINEMNIGLNKGNYYLNREINQRVSIDGEGRVSGEVDVKYNNTSTDKSPFGGMYKSYVRVVLPKDISLSSISIDGREQEVVPAVTDRERYTQEGFTPPRGLEVEEVIENEKKVIGILVTVPLQTTKTITIAYTYKQRATVEQSIFSYDHLIIKQPGTDKDAYTLELSYPVDVRLVESSQGVSDLGGKLIFENPLSQDLRLHLDFAKQ